MSDRVAVRGVPVLLTLMLLLLALPVPSAAAPLGGPTVTLSLAAGQTDPATTQPIIITAEFSEDVEDFDDAADVTISGTSGGTKTATITAVDGNTYTIAVSGATSSGTVVVQIPDNAAIAASAPLPLLPLYGNMASNSLSVQFNQADTTNPTVTVNQAAGQTDPTGTAPINFTIDFSEPVTGFAPDDVTITGTAGGTKVVALSGPGAGDVYTASVTGMTTAGTVIASVAAGRVTDAAGLPNAASTSADNQVQWSGPSGLTVTVNQAQGQADPTSTSPIHFTVVFSGPVTDFDDTADVAITGTAGGTKTPTITPVQGSNGTTYTVSVAIGGAPTAGTVIVNVPAGVATAMGAATTNQASTSTDNTVTFTAGAPTVTINQAQGQADPATTAPITFTAEFSEDVTGFGNAASDVVITGTAGGTKTATVTAVDANTYTIAVSGMTTPGTVIVSVPAGAAMDAQNNPNAASSGNDNTVTWGGTAPTADDDDYTVPTNGELEVDAPGVLENDTAEGDADLTATLVEDAEHGTLVLDEDGSFTYDPDEGFVGEDSFTYTAGNGVVQSEPATVTITVTSGAIVITPGVGNDNVARAIAWSRVTNPDGAFAQAGRTVLLGRDDLFADSLASGGAQGVLGAPLLLTGSGGLDARDATELDRLGAERVILLGGTAALSEQIVTDLTDRGYVVERLFGDSRLETAAAVARRIAPQATQVVIARAFPAEGGEATQAFADALAAGALAADLGIPLLLTETGRLSDPTRAYLEEAGVTQAFLVGGTAAISPQVVQDLTAIQVVSIRLAGDTRFATATAIAGHRGATGGADDADASILVNGTDVNAWADAFPAALLSSLALIPIVLADGDALPQPTLTYLDGGQTPLICGTTASPAACDAAEEALAG